jgi:hypothetical protein
MEGLHLYRCFTHTPRKCHACHTDENETVWGSENPGLHLARACAVEMHTDISQGNFYVRNYCEKTEGQRAYPDLTPVFDTYCKNPAVWTHCLRNSVPQTLLHICRTTSIISHIVLSQHTSNSHAHAQLCHRQLFHTQSATHTDNHVMLFADLSSTVSFTFAAFPIPFSHLFRVYWKNLTCGVLRSFNLLALET